VLPTDHRSVVRQCIVCDRKTVSEIAAQIDDAVCCRACTESHDGPGAFQVYSTGDGYRDLEKLGKCLILHAWLMQGMEDDAMWNDGWGYCARFGEYLFSTDRQGFHSFEEYLSVEAAEKAFMDYYRDGWGASENDAYIENTHHGYEISFDGKSLDVWARQSAFDPRGIDEKRCIARVRLEAMKTGYYPNLWLVFDDGNLTLIEY
jgi:hypothetical protein